MHLCLYTFYFSEVQHILYLYDSSSELREITNDFNSMCFPILHYIICNHTPSICIYAVLFSRVSLMYIFVIVPLRYCSDVSADSLLASSGCLSKFLIQMVCDHIYMVLLMNPVVLIGLLTKPLVLAWSVFPHTV